MAAVKRKSGNDDKNNQPAKAVGSKSEQPSSFSQSGKNQKHGGGDSESDNDKMEHGDGSESSNNDAAEQPAEEPNTEKTTTEEPTTEETTTNDSTTEETKAPAEQHDHRCI